MTLREIQQQLRKEGPGLFESNPALQTEFASEFLRLTTSRGIRTNPLPIITNRVRNPNGDPYTVEWMLPIAQIAEGVFSVPDYIGMAAQSLVRFFLNRFFFLLQQKQKPQILMDEEQVVSGINRELRRFEGGAIIGRRWALDSIWDEIEEDVKDSLYRRGVIGTYRGSYVILINDQYNPFIVSNYIDHRTLLITGSVPGAYFGYTVEPLESSTFDAATAVLKIGIRTIVQMEVTNPKAYRLFQVGTS